MGLLLRTGDFHIDGKLAHPVQKKQCRLRYTELTLPTAPGPPMAPWRHHCDNAAAQGGAGFGGGCAEKGQRIHSWLNPQSQGRVDPHSATSAVEHHVLWVDFSLSAFRLHASPVP